MVRCGVSAEKVMHSINIKGSNNCYHYVLTAMYIQSQVPEPKFCTNFLEENSSAEKNFLIMYTRKLE